MSTDVEVRGLLEAWKNGDPEAFARLVPLIYDELRTIARRCFASERPDHTLQPTALVAEVYLKLENVRSLTFEGQEQLLAFLAKVMRRILVDHARGHGAEKRWASLIRRPLEAALDKPLTWHPEERIAFDQALERLAELDLRQARIVDLRLLGLCLEDIAESVGCSSSTVHRELRTAELWLRAAIHANRARESERPC